MSNYAGYQAPYVAATYLKSQRRGAAKPIRRQPSADIYNRVVEAFDYQALHDICVMSEDAFAVYGTEVQVDQEAPHDFYFFKDNGSRILAVAHLDSCESEIMCDMAQTAQGPIVFSGSLDDRLGAYVILDMLPRLGITCDWLLTTGEEVGKSTADYFEHPTGKQYDWIIQFDRGGTDVVMYDYETSETVSMVEATGRLVGMGSFSDICMLEHLGCKAFNWGVGYRDYHGPQAHVWLRDLFIMVEAFVYFHEQHAGEHMPHTEAPDRYKYYSDLETERYDGVIVLKGDRTRLPSGRVETVDYGDADDQEALDDWLERHQARASDRDDSRYAERDAPGEVCLGCMQEVTQDGFCFSCDDLQ